MKKQTLLPPEDITEALLHGLIADCQAVIRDTVLTGIGDAVEHHHRRMYISSVNELVDSAVKLSDAITRLRGNAPVPEMRQRITVEKIQRLSKPQGEGV